MARQSHPSDSTRDPLEQHLVEVERAVTALRACPIDDPRRPCLALGADRAIDALSAVLGIPLRSLHDAWRPGEAPAVHDQATRPGPHWAHRPSPLPVPSSQRVRHG